MRTTPCTMYSPLFEIVYGGTRLNTKRERISPKHITNAIVRMLPAAQVDNTGFTSKLTTNQCERAASRPQNERACQGSYGAS